MRSGDLRHRVTIQTATESANASGDLVLSWSDLADVWASIEPLAGREYLDAKIVKADMSTRIRIRWRGDVTEEARIVWEDPYAGRTHTYDIDTVLPDRTHRRELTLMCSEVMS